MSLFLKKYNEVVEVAKQVSRLCDNRFEPEELVNEAWIRFEEHENKDIPLFNHSIKCDMIDYVRTQIGRKTKRYKVNFITNIEFTDEESPDRHQCSILEGSYINHNLDRLENKEYANYLTDLILDLDTRFIMKEYFLKGKKLREVGALINRSESKVSCIIKDCINKLRQEENSKL